MPAEAPLLDSDLEIREALPDDAHAIAALYVWHVLNGRASFEEIPPTVDEMRKRIQTVRDNGLPWLVALWRGADFLTSATAMPLSIARVRPIATPSRNRYTWNPEWADAASAARCCPG